jgi:hypothetical protein
LFQRTVSGDLQTEKYEKITMIAELGGSDEMKKYIIAQYYLSECY